MTEIIVEKPPSLHQNLGKGDFLKPLTVSKTMKLRLKSQRATLEIVQSLFVFSLDLGMTSAQESNSSWGIKQSRIG